MSKNIASIEGVGTAYRAKLNLAGIQTLESLLEKGASKTGRKEIAEASGIDEKMILDFINMADLFRIKGVAGQFAELLKAAGVDTVKELRTRNPENLYHTLMEVNEKKNLTRNIPSLTRIEEFIEQAKHLEPLVTH